jgi:hypothetical protein
MNEVGRSILVNVDRSLIEFAHNNPITEDEIRRRPDKASNRSRLWKVVAILFISGVLIIGKFFLYG